jgi:FkbM family methyltransferase
MGLTIRHVNRNPILSFPQRAVDKLRQDLFPIDSFLKKVRGVIHVGANTGQERDNYASHGLNVIWVEPIPTVFETLLSNISGIANQHAYNCLLTADHGKEYIFHISNNGGQSSSILDLAEHREMWPDVQFTEEISITSTTLTHLVETEHIDLRNFGALVLDTQGSELLVLKGAIPILNQFQFIKAEVADFESYAGCCRLEELSDFMQKQGFSLSRKSPFAARNSIGTYYDILYRRSRVPGHLMH